MAKNLRRTIRESIGRYLAIMVIIALGASLFVGLLSTKADMVATGQKYMDAQHMFDLRLISTYGWTQKEVDAVAKMTGVEYAEGAVTLDVIGRQMDGAKDSVYKVHTLPQKVDQVYLLGGRMPENANECLVDGHLIGDEVLGREFVIARENTQDTLDALVFDSYTIVGYISSPLYMDMSRGSTSIGNGNVAGYVYVPGDGVELDYFTEIAVTLEGSYTIYSDAYTKALEDIAHQLKPGVTLLASDRFAGIRNDAEEEYANGYREYEDGLADFTAARAEAMESLQNAWKELEDAQKQIDENRMTLQDAIAQLQLGQEELDAQLVAWQEGLLELANQKSQAYQTMLDAHNTLMENLNTTTQALEQVNAGIAECEDGLPQLESAISQLQDGLSQLREGLGTLLQMEAQLIAEQQNLEQLLQNATDEETIGQLTASYGQVQMQLQAVQGQLQQLQSQEQQLSAQLTQLEQLRETTLAQYQELLALQPTLVDAMDQIQAGFRELENNYLQAQSQFAAADAQLQAAKIQLDAAQKELDHTLLDLQDGLRQLDDAQLEWNEGKEEYETAKSEAEEELAEAEEKLADAAAKLVDARETIDSMEAVEVYILDRNSNVGYLAVESNSDIVQGVSRVLPAFFLLVAALVCITTMTRMVDEERTQIGTFKALGYGNGAIISKYLLYAGSASVLGCGLGVTIGSMFFPIILWDVYGLLLNLVPNVVIKINWPLCIAMVGTYATVMLLVTWYCCRRTLREVPAELIRPQAPTTGKKIWLEFMPFWRKISFLNKVMLRNIFRYRQRLLMMLCGIGGCTALLLTGFGLRDSIVNVVTDQFDHVTTYDLQVYFADVQTPEEQQAFKDAVADRAGGVHFFYQTGVDLEFAASTSELYMIMADEAIRDFVHFSRDGESLPMPEVNEVLLSIGVAEKMGISVGDRILLRDSDMRELDVVVSGLYENRVHNYVIVTPQTLEAQWGSVPGNQMAVLNAREGGDVHQLSAEVSDLPNVLNVLITEDTAEQVTSMLEALDTIVVVIVVCAGALAFSVLYNLTNINITERIREIATIKVLGFRSSESAAYVFKENLLLTAMGMVFGLFLGKCLLDFVISQVKIDMIWLCTSIKPMSCVYAMVLTILSAIIVDFALYFKLEKINMAEALKSVE